MVDTATNDGDFDAKPVILKFGSSILPNKDHLPAIVTEIYRYIRAGRKVVAIVSAFAGETDRLLEEAQLLGAGSLSPHAPALIGLGEARAVSLLAIACDRTGIHAVPLDVRQVGLRASGAIDDAVPTQCDTSALLAALEKNDVVIIPGYLALGENDVPVLLGRGGSDLSAVIIAKSLGIDMVTLFKSVPNVFDGNGVYAEHGKGGQDIYDFISPETASQYGNALIQGKALSYATENNVSVQISGLGALNGVQISSEDSVSKKTSDVPPVRVGVAGLGVVGEGAVLRLIADPDRYVLTSILVHNADKKRNDAINQRLLTTDVNVFLGSKPDIIVDLMSSGEAGATLMAKALTAGISVVSANKQAVADDLAESRKTTDDKGIFLAYGAAVGGGAPMVETVAAAHKKGPIVSIDAVLNGTVNFILSELQSGAAFNVALRAAQDAGFAEADPSADLSGDDARAKAAILAYEAFGASLADIDFDIEGLDADKGASLVAKGGAWRQVTRIRPKESGRVAVTVAYEQVDADPFLSQLHGESNAVRVLLESGDVMVARGRGAGRVPTVESVLGDLGAYRRQVYAQK